MNGNEFCKRFQLASYFCRDFTNRHIQENLPESLRYNFALSEREKGLEKINLTGKILNQDELTSVTPKIAAGILYRNGFFPVWIDLFVGGFDEQHTYVEVTFSADFTDEESDLYHLKEGYPPFHVIGPTVPEGWKSLERDGCFAFRQFS